MGGGGGVDKSVSVCVSVRDKALMTVRGKKNRQTSAWWKARPPASRGASEETKRTEAFTVTPRRKRQVHEPLRKGELPGVLDEAIATGADDEGAPGLDAVLHHHVGGDATRMQGHLTVDGWEGWMG